MAPAFQNAEWRRQESEEPVDVRKGRCRWHREQGQSTPIPGQDSKLGRAWRSLKHISNAREKGRRSSGAAQV